MLPVFSSTGQSRRTAPVILYGDLVGLKVAEGGLLVRFTGLVCSSDELGLGGDPLVSFTGLTLHPMHIQIFS